MTTVLRDVLRGGRLFVHQPAFAWAAAVTLALAIGANTLIFTIANVLVVKPLPFQDPDTLGFILVSMPGRTADRAGTSLPEYADFRDGVPAFSRLAAWQRSTVTLRERETAERVTVQRVVGDLQGLWGLAAVRGRRLSAADESRGATPVLVLSHRFWSTRFGGDDAIVGRDLLVDGEPHTVAGVLAPDVELGNLAEIDVWVPLRQDPALASRAERGWRPVGRLREGATLGDAHAQAAALAGRLEQEHPETNRDWIVRVAGTRDAMAGSNTWLVLALLAVVVGLLLLLACANVMNLLIARLIGRRQELAVRTALGATRGRVVRQIIGESLMLGFAGGLLGLAVAWGGLRGIHAVSTEPFFRQLAFDYRVIAFAVILAFVAPLIFSTLPAFRVLREDIRTTLNEGSIRTIGSAATARGRSVLVVLQVSVAVTLLIVAALVVQSMQSLIDADPGYDSSKLLVAEIDVPPWKAPDEAEALRLRQRLVAHLAEMPGAQRVAMATYLPALHTVPQVSLDIDSRTGGTDPNRPAAALMVVSPDYFETVGVPILEGRGFREADAASPRAVAVVSAEAERRFWPSRGDAVGSTARIADPGGHMLEATIVGVAADTANPLASEGPVPTLFLLDEHRPTRSMYVLVRAETPGQLATPFRRAVSEVDPDLVAFQLRTLPAAFADENSSNRLLSGLFAGFALVAILLATAGLYGVMSYAVSQRSGEIAVRMALGAPRGTIARQVLVQSVRLAALGTLIGAVGALGLARAIGSLLFGITPSDPATYAGTIALTIAASVAATWIPMRRATLVDPVQTLR